MAKPPTVTPEPTDPAAAAFKATDEAWSEWIAANQGAVGDMTQEQREEGDRLARALEAARLG